MDACSTEVALAVLARASICPRTELGEQDYRLAEEARAAGRAAGALKRVSTPKASRSNRPLLTNLPAAPHA